MSIKNTTPRYVAPSARACLIATLALPTLAMAQAATGTTTLSPITVQGQIDAEALPPAAPGGQVATGSRLGILGNKDVMDTPFNTTSYTSGLIQDQQARTVGEVLLNDPSVRTTTNAGHMYEHFTIRGLRVDGADMAFNGMYGVMPFAHVPIEFIERVEVLRGPSSMLTSMGPTASLGGMINLVPKRAGSTPIADLTTSYVSPGYGQAHVDLGRRFGDEERLGIRFNGVYGTGETGVSGQRKGRELGALGLDYAGDNWRVSLDAYSSREDIENGSPAMYQMSRLGQLVRPPNNSSNLFRGTSGVQRDYGFALRGELDINEHLTAYAAFGGSNSRGRGLMFGTRTVVTGTDGSALGYVYNVDSEEQARVGEVGLRAKFQTGSVSHTMTLAGNVGSFEQDVYNRPNAGYPQNIYDPIRPDFPDSPDRAGGNGYDDVLTSVALADTLGFAKDKVQVTLGGRYQRVRQGRGVDYDESKITPMAAVVLKPWGEDTSLYANYIEGLQPGETVGLGYLNEGETFKPTQSRQVEFGIKLRRGDYLHTFSAFQIDKSFLGVSLEDAGDRIAEGKQRNRGLEWTVSGKLTRTLTVLGGVSYLTSEQRTTVGDGKKGNDIYGSPNWLANLGLEWATPVQGLSLNGRVIYTGPQWLDSANDIRMPSWTRVDVGAKYATRISNTPVTFYANVDNLFDRDYWDGTFADGFATLSPQRTLRLGATISF
ncbi:TonB-dependent receptor [Bordetella petrii]|uniref:TonB-dependent receptor n=1 Tax=Bordetella petrii TaxID=94624 RepID=UPI001E3F31F2|nr:TonB-dependent siderophore receptor [Bordetella petrii]MCD0504549.1 TonB-dependent siderophore receptor [Bordetella petrii]